MKSPASRWSIDLVNHPAAMASDVVFIDTMFGEAILKVSLLKSAICEWIGEVSMKSRDR